MSQNSGGPLFIAFKRTKDEASLSSQPLDLPRFNGPQQMAPKNPVIITRHVTRSAPPTSRPTLGSPTVIATSNKDSSD